MVFPLRRLSYYMSVFKVGVSNRRFLIEYYHHNLVDKKLKYMQAIMNFVLPTKAKFAFFIGFRYANWITIWAIKPRINV